MPKFPSLPTLYDDCKTICISDLTRWDYLQPAHTKSGTVTWSRNGHKTGSISIYVNTLQKPFLELDYQCDKVPINYKVQLVTVPSNLGKGVVWYFICPHTSKKCKKLHLVDTHFFHRSAFTGCMYKKQNNSRRTRFADKQFELFFGVENVYKKLHSKHFKSFYAGKPTKEYVKLTGMMRLADSISEAEMLRLI